MLETKCIKSGGKSQFYLSFLSYTVNDVRRKLYMVGIQLAVGKRARRMPDTTVETTLQLVIVCAISSCFSLKVRCLLRIKWHAYFKLFLLLLFYRKIWMMWYNLVDEINHVVAFNLNRTFCFMKKSKQNYGSWIQLKIVVMIRKPDKSGHQGPGALFSKLIYTFDISFGNFLLWNTRNCM